MALIEEISLDTLRPTQFVSIRLQQNDALDRKIDVQITEGSDIYTIPTSGAVISLRMVKPDGNPIDNICEVINNKARFTITEQMTVISGRCSAQIKITNSSTGGILKTVKFNILIDEEIISDSMIVSTGEFTALQAALLEVGDITNKVDKSNIVNNGITTVEGTVLDGRMGKTLQDQVTTINNNLAILKTNYALTVKGTATTQIELDAIIDNTSNYILNSIYEYVVACGGGLSLPAGNQVIRGYKYQSDNYGWQQATTYGASGIVIRFRSKNAGVWTDWIMK